MSEEKDLGTLEVSKNDNDKDNKEKTNKLLFINQTYFVYSTVTLVKMLQDVCEQLFIENKIAENKKEVYNKFKQTCKDIITEYQSSSSSLDDTTIDHVKIIKKAFYVLKDNLELVKNKDAALFTVRNKENKITTIIPGLNINLIYQYLTDEQKAELWINIYTIFVSTVTMVYANTSSSRHKKNVLDAVDYCKKELALTSNPILNVFMGLGNLKIN